MAPKPRLSREQTEELIELVRQKSYLYHVTDPDRADATMVANTWLVITEQDERLDELRCRQTKSSCTLKATFPQGSSGQASGQTPHDLGTKLEAYSENVTLQLLSMKLGQEWKNVCRRLGVGESTIYQKETDHHGHIQEVIYQCLLSWKHNTSNTTAFETLRMALEENNRSDLAQYIKKYEELLQKPNIFP